MEARCAARRESRPASRRLQRRETRVRAEAARSAQPRAGAVLRLEARPRYSLSITRKLTVEPSLL